MEKDKSKKKKKRQFDQINIMKMRKTNVFKKMKRKSLKRKPESYRHTKMGKTEGRTAQNTRR